MKAWAGMRLRVLLAGGAFALYLAPGTANACPPGFTPNAAGTPGVPCVPANPSSGNDGGGSQSSGMQWESRWGSFAFDEATGAVGSGAKMSSRGRSRKAAMAHCQANGGAKCKVEFDYTNQCGAIAMGKTRAGLMTRYYRSEVKLNDATDGALRGCGEQGGIECQIILSDCSRPQRV